MIFYCVSIRQMNYMRGPKLSEKKPGYAENYHPKTFTIPAKKIFFSWPSHCFGGSAIDNDDVRTRSIVRNRKPTWATETSPVSCMVSCNARIIVFAMRYDAIKDPHTL
mmetsp:Transcript_3674/g.16189  ORF Transcript_3674/g.16189 Transcript_3674/m.16189 type:complete len:108 (-) Transcript_3674:910-1233(-)